MEILFGLLILVLLAVALLNRRREKKTWLREERYDESGSWIDKRAGERGTYGSLDAEREAERHTLTRQGRINDLALDIRNFAFEHIPGFHERSTADIKAFTTEARDRANQLFSAIEALKTGQIPETPDTAPDDPRTQALKKCILHFSYEHYPWLLDQDLEAIQQFDRYVAVIAQNLLAKANH
jgi:hypothetical protein